MPMRSTPGEIAVIGAGIAGMSMAACLTQAGHRVQVFEKSRGPGGRSSTRRREALRFDHGAPYFQAKDPEFVKTVQNWETRGWVQHWETQHGRARPHQELQTFDATPLVTIPKMSSLARAIGEGVPCTYATRIASLHRTAAGWELRCTEGQTFHADRVVLTAPPPQSLALLDRYSPQLSTELNTVQVHPDWTVMLSGHPDLLPPQLGWMDFVDHPCLAKLIAEHRKPQRPQEPAWTLHAHPDWSRTHEEQSPQWVLTALGQALEKALGHPIELEQGKAHRWRYARVSSSVAQPFLADTQAGLYYCGDACLNGDLESAYRSGRALAHTLHQGLSHKQSP